MRALSLVLGLAVSTSAFAICPTATPVGAGAAVATGSTIGAGNDYFPTCGASNAEDAAYEFTAPTAGNYEFDLIGSTYDTVLAAFDTADCATQLACNDDFSGLQSGFTLAMTAGQTVLLVIDGFSSGAGDYVLNIASAGACGDGVLNSSEQCDDGNLVDGDGCESDCTITPACGNGILEGAEECDDGNLVDGDGCESTCTITPGVCAADFDIASAVGAGVAVGNTCGALNDARGATCGGGQESEDLYHMWTAPADGWYQIDTNGSSYDTALTVRDTACNEIYCDDDGGDGLQSLIFEEFAAGDQVMIAVDGFGSFACGDYALNITQPFYLFTDDPIPGSPMTFQAVNAPPNANVYFLVSGRVDATNPLCHPVVTTACTDLQRPTVVGNVRADAAGVASITLTAPASLPSGFTVWSQAFWLQQGNGAVSNLNLDFTP